jgi:hypothetical protein
LTDFTEIRLAYGAARETAVRLPEIIKDCIKKGTCHITLQLFSHDLTEINLWLKSGERSGHKARHIYRNKQEPHCVHTTYPCALTVEHFKAIRVNFSLNIGENGTLLIAEAKGTARWMVSDRFSQQSVIG